MTLVFRWSLVLVLLAAASAFSGCDMAGQVSESMAHAAPIETEIEAAVGVKPHVFGASTGPVFSKQPSAAIATGSSSRSRSRIDCLGPITALP